MSICQFTFFLNISWSKEIPPPGGFPIYYVDFISKVTWIVHMFCDLTYAHLYKSSHTHEWVMSNEYKSSHTHEWVMSHKWASHKWANWHDSLMCVTWLILICIIYIYIYILCDVTRPHGAAALTDFIHNCDMTHSYARIETNHITYMHESCHTCKWVTSHIWIGPCHTYDWFVSHICMSHVTHMNESLYT